MKPKEDLVPVFKALGDPTRLKILDLLRSRGKSCCKLVSRAEHGLCAEEVELFGEQCAEIEDSRGKLWIIFHAGQAAKID